MATLFLPVTAREVPFSNSALYVSVRVAPGSPLDDEALDARLDAALGPECVRVAEVSAELGPYLQKPRFQAILFGSVAVGIVALPARRAAATDPSIVLRSQ